MPTITVPHKTSDGNSVDVTFDIPDNKLKLKDGKVVGGDKEYIKQAAQMSFESRYPNEAGSHPPGPKNVVRPSKWTDIGSYNSQGEPNSFLNKRVNVPIISPMVRSIEEGLNAPTSGKSWQGRTADVLEGGMSIAAGTSIPALVSHPSALLKGTAGMLAGGFAGRKGAEIVGAEPDTQRLAEDIGGLGGGVLAATPRGAISPRLRNMVTSGMNAASEAPVSRVGAGIGSLVGAKVAPSMGLPAYAGMGAGAAVGGAVPKIPAFIRGASQAKGDLLGPELQQGAANIFDTIRNRFSAHDVPVSGPIHPPVHPPQGIPEYSAEFTMPGRGGQQPPVQPVGMPQLQSGMPPAPPPSVIPTNTGGTGYTPNQGMPTVVHPPTALPPAGPQLQIPERSPIEMRAGHPVATATGANITPPGTLELPSAGEINQPKNIVRPPNKVDTPSAEDIGKSLVKSVKKEAKPSVFAPKKEQPQVTSKQAEVVEKPKIEAKAETKAPETKAKIVSPQESMDRKIMARLREKEVLTDVEIKKLDQLINKYDKPEINSETKTSQKASDAKQQDKSSNVNESKSKEASDSNAQNDKLALDKIIGHVNPSWNPEDEISRDHLVKLADALGVKQGPLARSLQERGKKIQESKFARGWGLGPTKTGLNKSLDELDSKRLSGIYRRLVVEGKIKE